MYSYIAKSLFNDHLGSINDPCYIKNRVIMNHGIKRLRCMFIFFQFFSNFTVKLISTQTTDANRNNCIQAIKDNLTVFNFPTNSLYCPGATNNVQSFINTTGLTTTEGAFDCLTQSYLLIVSDIGTKCSKYKSL